MVWFKTLNCHILKLTRHIEALEDVFSHPALTTQAGIGILGLTIALLKTQEVTQQRMEHSLDLIHRLACYKVVLDMPRAILALQSKVCVGNAECLLKVYLISRSVIEVEVSLACRGSLHSHCFSLILSIL